MLQRDQRVVQYFAVCYSVMQRVAVYCSVLQCDGKFASRIHHEESEMQCVAVCCSVLQCVTASCSALQCDAKFALQHVLQCVAVRCSAKRTSRIQSAISEL